MTHRKDEVETSLHRFAVIGAGAWGTALAIAAARAGRDVTLWAREPTVADGIAETRENALFLPDCWLPATVTATSDLAEAAASAEALILVVPSRFLRAVCRDLKPLVAPGLPIVICSKGVERASGKLPAAVVADELPGHPLAVLSGPSFAREVALGQPTAVAIASDDVRGDPQNSLAARLAEALGTPLFRPYVSDDMIGLEVGGAVKNVIAIACGVAAGLGFGANTRAALITRGLAEIARLGAALGGGRETALGLAGVGDLTLTCSNEQSRNMRYGIGLARGDSFAEMFGGRPVEVEGVENAVTITDLARRLDLDLPICEAVRAVVAEGQPLGDAMEAMLARPFRAEARNVRLFIPQPKPADPSGRRLVLATDLDGTFLGGSDDSRRALYSWIEANRDAVTLIFVTGRDLPFIRALVRDSEVPTPDYVIGDVGTTIAGGPGILPMPELEEDIARRWNDAGPRVERMLAGARGLRPQDTPFRYRMSYFYDPELLAAETVKRIEAAGFDCLLSAGTFLDVLPKGVSKGPTLERLVAHLGIAREDVLVAGDTLNDLSLFETGFAGVAVGNAEPALKTRIATLENVHQSVHPGAAGILDAIRSLSLLPEAVA